MVSRKEGYTNPEESNEKKNTKITDANNLLELASTRLSQLIGKISTLHGNMHFDIHEWNNSSSMHAVYDTLLIDVAFVIGYFNYTEVPHFLDENKHKHESAF